MDCEIESRLIGWDNVGIENVKIWDNICEQWGLFKFWFEILVWRKVWKFLDIFGINKSTNWSIIICYFVEDSKVSFSSYFIRLIIFLLITSSYFLFQNYPVANSRRSCSNNQSSGSFCNLIKSVKLCTGPNCHLPSTSMVTLFP